MEYTKLANILIAQWLRDFTYSEAQIARLRELNTPTIIIEGAMTPHLNSQQETIVYWLKQLDLADDNAAKKIRSTLRKNGFRLKARAIIEEAK